MALRSYKKDGYTYTESAPGSNKFQNFTAAKPTVKEVRKDSAKKKADAITSKGKPTESKMARDEATRKTSSIKYYDVNYLRDIAEAFRKRDRYKERDR